MFLSIIATLALGVGPETGADVGPFVRALWLVQRYGTADAVDPANDQRVKGALAKALGKSGAITLSKLDAFMEPDIFKKLAGSDDRLGPEEVREAVDASCRRAASGCFPRSGSMPTGSRRRST